MLFHDLPHHAYTLTSVIVNILLENNDILIRNNVRSSGGRKNRSCIKPKLMNLHANYPCTLPFTVEAAADVAAIKKAAKMIKHIMAVCLVSI